MPDCRKCKNAIRGETGLICAGVCKKQYHTATKCSGIDNYSAGIIDTNPMVVFMCEDCVQYIHNVDFTITNIYDIMQKKFKEYGDKFDDSLKHHEDEMKSLLKAVEDRFKARVKVLSSAEKTYGDCVEKMQSLCKSADGVVENIKQGEQIMKEGGKIVQEQINQNKCIQAEMKQLSAVINTGNIKAASYSETLKTAQVPLIVRPKTPQSRSQTSEDLKKKVDPRNLNFSRVQIRHNGDLIISAGNEKDREKIRAEVEKNIGENYEIKTPAAMLPRLLVSGMSENMEDANLSSAIQKQNNEFNISSIKIIRQYQVKRGERSYYNAIIEVNIEAFSKILSCGKLNIGWERCRTYDGTRVLCCFKCKGFNHKAENCEEKEVCVKCLGEHRTGSCSLAPVNKCINCIRANEKFNLSLDCNHSSLDTTCPGYQKMLMAKKKKIGY